MLSMQCILFVILSCAWGGHSLRLIESPKEEPEEISFLKKPDEYALENMIDWALHDFMQPLRLWSKEPDAITFDLMKCDAEELEHRTFVIGSWHKSGTNLFRQVARNFNSVLNISSCVNNGCPSNSPRCSGDHFADWSPGKRNVFLCHAKSEYITELESRSQSNLRGVVTIRDPLAMLVSGYLYHKRASGDCDGCDCKEFRQMDMLDGLRIQAECTKRKVASILDTYRMAKKNPYVKVIRLENLLESSDNFDKYMKAIFEHLTSGCIGKAGEEKFAEASANLDLRRNPNPSGRDLGGPHVSQKDEIKKVMKVVLENGLDKEFYDARSELQYI